MKACRFLVFAVLLIALLCYGTTSAFAKGAKENVTISFIAAQGWLMAPEAPTLGPKFKDASGITVDYQLEPNDQYGDILLTKLSAHQLPDIWMHQNGKFDLEPLLHVAENCVDLSGEDWVKRMDPGAIEHDSYKGKLYGQTIWDFSPTFPITYNKDIFKQYGLSVPTSYAELKAVCQKLLDNGITPLYEPGGDGWPIPLWFLDIGQVYEAAQPGLEDALNNNKAKFADNKLMLTVLTEWKEMSDLGFMGKTALSDTFSGIPDALASGKFAMSMGGITEPQQTHDAHPEVPAERFGYFVDCLGDNQILDCGAQGPTRFITASSKYVAEAKAYFSFVAQTANVQALLDGDNTRLSLCFAGVKDKFTPAAKDYLAKYPTKGTYLQIQVKYVNPDWGNIMKDMTAMMLGKMTPLQVLQNIDTQRAAQAKDAKDPAWQ
ncbi:MAG: ABC transporter substrate-binding protein [Spirochaetia bacterium]|jgi:raffinose/stachyose/melibiose transport system substrate-binding protein